MDGILLFNKPIFWTSHDAVDFVRRHVGQRAVGHTGTLDPLASGLLVILLGRSTKLSQKFSDMDKDYSGMMTLGLTTDTQDLEGRILESRSIENVGESAIFSAFERMRGEQMQVPPAYSAVKKGGQKSYVLARQNLALDVQARPITISRLEILRLTLPDIHFSMRCSKGTYVRSLCDQIGRNLGVGAVLSSLCRTRIGTLELKKALNEEDLKKIARIDLERYCHENLSGV